MGRSVKKFFIENKEAGKEENKAGQTE